jgi:hypothetical protein
MNQVRIFLVPPEVVSGERAQRNHREPCSRAYSIPVRSSLFPIACPANAVGTSVWTRTSLPGMRRYTRNAVFPPMCASKRLFTWSFEISRLGLGSVLMAQAGESLAGNDSWEASPNGLVADVT